MFCQLTDILSLRRHFSLAKMDKLSAKEPHPKRGKHAKETEASSTVRHAQDVPVDVDGPGVVGYH